MKLRTRLRITFIGIIVLPLLLTIAAFMIIGIILTNLSVGVGMENTNYASMADDIREFGNTTNDIYMTLKGQIEQDKSQLENMDYLVELNHNISKRSTFLIVRKNDELYFAGNRTVSEIIFPNLPSYGNIGMNKEIGFFHDNRLMRQIDFEFSDGSNGSIFIVTTVSALISRNFLIYMFIAIVIILVFTSFMFTEWIRKGVFKPINELNHAMKMIKDGNFDYVLQSDSRGEIGDLYRNYEDMRLRLKESSEEKIEHEKQNRELVSNISHDLKTPITAIKGYVEGIMDGVADTPEKMDKYIKTIYNKANDMDKLINELTVYSGIDNNRIPYNFHRINVADYFGDCVEEVGLDLESKNIKLDYINYVEKDTIVIADPEQMKKVINNIISNSVKYMDKPEGAIEIRILDEVDSIRVEIEDNGKGIAQKDLQKIFDRFYRTDASRNSAQGGSGIGLSIVKKIIEDHGGYIWATGKEGEGTCIHFVIRKYIELQPQD